MNQPFQTLLDKYLSGAISEEERLQLNKLLEQEQFRRQLEAIMDKELSEHSFESEEDVHLLTQIQQNIDEKIKERDPTSSRLVRINWRRIAAAAVLILLTSAAAYWFWNTKKPNEAIAVTKDQNKTNDVAPGGNKAVLELADGSKIILDSANNGTLAKQSSVSIIKLDNGQLAYNSQKGKPSEILYNTISTPKGGQYQLVLSDGTKVWLNAASSLRFPAAFVGKERNVELKGEGYFEVAKNAAMPFRVRVNDMEVQVLGTHFNINAYADEADTRTTLLEGSIRFLKGSEAHLVKPGQQVVAPHQEPIVINDDVDLDEVMAWKNGMFQFESADLKTILRQAARWYDIDIAYEDEIKDRFSGQISRNVNLSQLLKILELTGRVHFEIEGKRIIVKSKMK